MTSPIDELEHGRIGRVPVWAVGVGLAGAFVLFMYIRNRKKASAVESSIPSDTTTLDQSGSASTAGSANYGLPQGSIGDFLNNNPLDPAYPTGLTANGIPAPVTNVQWSRLAFDYLIGQGNDPALVESALSKYINGQTLSQAERSVVNLAQLSFGAPPEGLIVSGAPGTPGTNVTGTTDSTSQKSVTVTPQENLYGVPLQNGTTWWPFVNLNGGQSAFYANINWGPDKDAAGNPIPHLKQTMTLRVI